MTTKKSNRVVFKLHDHITPPDDAKAVGQHFERENVDSWRKITQLYSALIIRRLFVSAKLEDIGRKIELAEKLATGKGRKFSPPTLNHYFVIKCPIEINEIAMVGFLHEFKSVEFAYVEATSSPMPPSVNPSNDPRSVDQKYLDPEPVGINARFAWTKEGGDGTSRVRFVDIEQGWKLDHEDLIGANVELLGGENMMFKKHGTNVLGIILAQDNSTGCVGITPSATANVISEWRLQSDIDETAETDEEDRFEINTADAIYQAIHSLAEGDIILIEAEKDSLPVEADPGCYAAIRFGFDLDIIIIEAAGNGKNDLDQIRKPALNRNHEDFEQRDSGAIIVGACTVGVPHRRREGQFGSNFGSRVDCYAWGAEINTTSTDADGSESTYISDFSETSGASAIIAGVVISIQSMHEKANRTRFTPEEMRKILQDPDCGTASSNPDNDKIGLMPDLKKIYEKYIG